MTFRFTRALPYVFLLVAGLCHGADEPLALAAASSLSKLPQEAAETPPSPATSPAAPATAPATATATPVASAPSAVPETPVTPRISAPAAPALAAPAESTSVAVEDATPPTGATLPTTELAAPPTLPGTIDLVTPPDDIFQRIRNGFAMPNLTGDLVLAQQQWYLNRPDYLRRMVDRSSRYLYFIVEELESRGMPSELAFLPMVESAYNPMAYSRSHASGLWQFIPSTGKNYNLKQDWWVDERRDVVAATSAALDYLQSIYEMHGDWFLALASYNWGEGAVARAIRKNEAKGLPTDYQSLTMPAETRNYVPKLQALKNIFSNPQLLAQLDLPAVPNRAYFATITPTTNIDVKVAARLAEMPVQEFVALNPSHNRPVIKSDTQLVIPAEKLDTFQANLESHQEDDKPLSKWQTYTLRHGDKLEKIAHSFHISLADLKRVNGLNTRRRPPPGQTLLVPATDGVGSADMAALPEQPQVLASEALATAKTLIVKRGETLGAVARRGGVTVAELRRLNHLKSDRVNAGARLVVAAPTRSVTVATAGPAPRAAAKSSRNAGKGPRIKRYTVKRGDTLYSIARRFNVEQKDLMRWNGNTTASLHPGQQLTIQLAQND